MSFRMSENGSGPMVSKSPALPSPADCPVATASSTTWLGGLELPSRSLVLSPGTLVASCSSILLFSLMKLGCCRLHVTT